MKILKTEKKKCSCCMEEHEVKTVRVKEKASMKSETIEYDAVYFYCENADEYFMDEKQMQENDLRLKNAYRKQMGLLTADQISSIREKYGISQGDLCLLLGWGGKTVTRYEGHQIQDKAHDTILKKLDEDPEWFLLLLDEAKPELQAEAFSKYATLAAGLCQQKQDAYLRKAIEAQYAVYQENPSANGNTRLSLDKAVDMIRYFAASTDVMSLYKVKLMKLLWYADAASFKQRGTSISGMVYQALPMGAVPVGHDSLIHLQDVPCEEIDMGEANAYHFSLKGQQDFPSLTKEDIAILDYVIQKLGWFSKKEIVDFMHQEQAFLKTPQHEMISFAFAKDLQI